MNFDDFDIDYLVEQYELLNKTCAVKLYYSDKIL